MEIHSLRLLDGITLLLFKYIYTLYKKYSYLKQLINYFFMNFYSCCRRLQCFWVLVYNQSGFGTLVLLRFLLCLNFYMNSRNYLLRGVTKHHALYYQSQKIENITKRILEIYNPLKIVSTHLISLQFNKTILHLFQYSTVKIFF